MRTGLLASLLLILSLSAFANGGGVYAISSVTRSSNPIFREIKDIELISEKLYIKLSQARSDITVEYVLWNNSDKDYIGVDYGFPIDYMKSKDVEDRSFEWKDSYIKDVSFILNDTSLSYHNSEGALLDEGSSLTSSMYRKWFYTKVDIKKNSIVSLKVNYSLENGFLCDGSSPLYMSVLDGCRLHSLSYDFSPASHWGSGVIRDFYVQIDASSLTLAGDLSDRKNDAYNGSFEPLELKGLSFDASDNIYTHHSRNFDLNNTKPLFISYLAQEESSLDIIKKYRISNDKYTIRTSKDSKKYPSSALSDMNFETAWVAENAGVGESIEISFKRPNTDLAGFSFVNGYWKNENTYVQNNRVAELKVEIKRVGEDWVEIGYKDAWSIPDEPYRSLYFENFFSIIPYYDFYDTGIDSNTENNSVEKLRFTILKVYPGTKYNDTCISEIFLFHQ